MRISVFGLGYVGVVSLACLARDGHSVIGVDINSHKLDLIRGGQTPVIEPGMGELMTEVVATNRVQITSEADYAIRNTEVSFVCVGTPARPNGSQNLDSITRLAEQLGQALKNKSTYHVIAIRSTVLPGTVEETIKPLIERHAGKKEGADFGLCFQPEFLREGSSIQDYDKPPYTVVGSNSQRCASVIRDIFGHLSCDFIRTSIRTAEMLKYCCNAFHALKITFANEVGRLSQALHVDSHSVMDLVCRDTNLNVSRAYLRPGFAFGGSCLPKDLRALLHAGKSNDIEVPMLANILPSNEIHIERAVDFILATGRKKIGLLGLSFKSDTDDLRESPLVAMAERLLGKGCKLRIYDPHVHTANLVGANREYIENTIPHLASLMHERVEDVIDDCDVLIVSISSDALMIKLPRLIREDQILLDLVSLPVKSKLRCRYQGVCW
jgi:GDP-mannose 6-dehydrogenase